MTDFSHGNMRASQHGPIIVTIYAGVTDAEQLSRYRDWLKVVLGATDGPVDNISVVFDTPSSMDQESRAVAQELTEMFAKKARAEAIVIEASGIKASFVRAIVTSLHLVTKSDHPRRVFKSTADGLSWVSTVDPAAMSHAQAAAQHLDELRSQFHQRQGAAAN
jgi:hypothetical protein